MPLGDEAAVAVGKAFDQAHMIELVARARWGGIRTNCRFKPVILLSCCWETTSLDSNAAARGGLNAGRAVLSKLLAGWFGFRPCTHPSRIAGDARLVPCFPRN